MRSLGLAVIAEGIECQSHLDLLVGEGCRIGQGYLFARPMPAEEFLALLETTGKKMPHVKFATG